MNDERAESAWQAWENKATWVHDTIDTRAAFFGGRASLDVDALLLAAVTLALEEAAKAIYVSERGEGYLDVSAIDPAQIVDRAKEATGQLPSIHDHG